MEYELSSSIESPRLWQNISMKTTLDLPDELLERARVAAKERGTTLPVLIGSALAKELKPARPVAEGRSRVRFPLFPSQHPGSLDLTNADLAQLEADEDRRRHGLPR